MFVRRKDLFQRRNEIAHQNDRSHASAVQTEITKEYVEEYVKAVDAIVNGIHKVALQRVAESNT